MSSTTEQQLATARDLLKQGSVAAARSAYQAALEAEPDCIDALLELGHLEREAGQLVSAEKLHRDAVNFAASAAAWTALGRTLADAGQPETATEAFTKALDTQPGYAPAHLHLGELYGASGQLERAQQCFERALQSDPQDAFAHHNLGVCAQLGNDLKGATGHFRAALQIRPAYWRSWQALGDIYRQVGEFATALTCYEQLLKLQPNADNLLRLGATRQLLGDYAGAIVAYQRVLDGDSKNTDALYNLGTCFQATGALDEAESILKKVLDANPDNHSAAAALAGVYDKRGDYDKGLALLQPRIKTAAANSELWVSLGRLARNGKAAAAVVEDLERALTEQAFTPVDRSRVAFTAGALRDATGDYDRAFVHFELANRLKPHSYQREVFEQGVQQLIDTFDTGLLARHESGINDDRRPVFIVGMPRCGSTLVERILTAHPQVTTIGENPLLSGLAAKLGSPGRSYPGVMADIDTSTLDQTAQRYLSALPPAGDRVIDKMLSNLVHIGLIGLLFRNARILHCSRHPLDIALSCYSHDFSGTQVGFAYALDDIVHYYRQYRKLMTHWETLGFAAMLPVRYESVVSDTEATVRGILNFLDLPYDADCLRFHEQDSLANTASYAQVRRPVYSNSVGRHRHYEKQLRSVAGALNEYLDNY